MFFHLQSTLNVPFSQRIVGCWHGFFCILVVKQVCPSLLICFLRFACYYVSSKFLLFLPGERFCFHLSQGYILWSLRSTADSGWPLNVNYLSSSSMLCCNQLSSTLLDERKKMPFVNQPVLLSWDSWMGVTLPSETFGYVWRHFWLPNRGWVAFLLTSHV